MCLGAIYWARPEKVFFACTRADAAQIGFDDDFIYEEFEKKNELRSMVLLSLMRDEALEVFNGWAAKSDKVKY
jgi:tRNA(Arg) A34 adenosine deaminase TadA